jgi:hypothetical protein
LALRFIDEPLAVTLLKGVIEDIEARIAAIESAGQPHDEGVFSHSRSWTGRFLGWRPLRN